VVNRRSGDLRIGLSTDRPKWRTIIAAAEGERVAIDNLATLTHPLLDLTWNAGSKAKVRDAAWQAIVAARTDMSAEEATDFFAAFFAHDPVRMLPKIDALRPVAVVVAGEGENFDPWPTRNGVRLRGRLIWFLDADDNVGQVPWPKVAGRERVSGPELIARATRLAVHSQIAEFRAATPTATCHMCNNLIEERSHVDHVYPFADLVGEWVDSNGVSEAVAGQITNPADGDPVLPGQLRQCWVSFHRDRAVLAHAHPQCNLSRGRRPL
jgi:hypothetical protein